MRLAMLRIRVFGDEKDRDLYNPYLPILPRSEAAIGQKGRDVYGN